MEACALPVVASGSCPFVQSVVSAAMLAPARDTARDLPHAHLRHTTVQTASGGRAPSSEGPRPVPRHGVCAGPAPARHRRNGDENHELAGAGAHARQRPAAAYSEPVREARTSSCRAPRRPKMCSMDVALGVLDDCSNARREPPSPASSAADSAGAWPVVYGSAGSEFAEPDPQNGAAQQCSMPPIGASRSGAVDVRAAGGGGELGDAGAAAALPRNGPEDWSVRQSAAAKRRLLERCDADHVAVRIWRSANRAARREVVKVQSPWYSRANRKY